MAGINLLKIVRIVEDVSGAVTKLSIHSSIYPEIVFASEPFPSTS